MLWGEKVGGPIAMPPPPQKIAPVVFLVLFGFSIPAAARLTIYTTLPGQVWSAKTPARVGGATHCGQKKGQPAGPAQPGKVMSRRRSARAQVISFCGEGRGKRREQGSTSISFPALLFRALFFFFSPSTSVPESVWTYILYRGGSVIAKGKIRVQRGEGKPHRASS